MRMKLIALTLLALITIPLVGYSTNNISASTSQTATNEKKPLYWVDPMEPNVHYKAPGKSRMGMELVPVYTKDKGNQQ